MSTQIAMLNILVCLSKMNIVFTERGRNITIHSGFFKKSIGRSMNTSLYHSLYYYDFVFCNYSHLQALSYN